MSAFCHTFTTVKVWICPTFSSYESVTYVYIPSPNTSTILQWQHSCLCVDFSATKCSIWVRKYFHTIVMRKTPIFHYKIVSELNQSASVKLQENERFCKGISVVKLWKNVKFISCQTASSDNTKDYPITLSDDMILCATMIPDKLI